MIKQSGLLALFEKYVVTIIVKELSFSLAVCHGIQAFRDKGKQCIICSVVYGISTKTQLC